MLATKVGVKKTGQRMGHMSMSGDNGTIEIFIYSIAILLTTILFWWFTNLGYVFLVLSLLNNIIYSYFCYKLLIVKDRQTARNAYLYSLLHLALVFLFIVIDTLV